MSKPPAGHFQPFGISSWGTLMREAVRRTLTTSATCWYSPSAAKIGFWVQLLGQLPHGPLSLTNMSGRYQLCNFVILFMQVGVTQSCTGCGINMRQDVTVSTWCFRWGRGQTHRLGWKRGEPWPVYAISWHFSVLPPVRTSKLSLLYPTSVPGHFWKGFPKDLQLPDFLH